MAKYSKDFRLQVVKEIESGKSLKSTAKKFNVSLNSVQGWWRRYSKGGVKQLLSTNQKYSRDFKLEAIEYRWANGLSYPQAASDLGIPNHSTLYTWEKLYLEKGASGLLDTMKGRPVKMPKKDNNSSKNEHLTREQQLEAENAQLRMENAYLKKLNALVAEREKSKKKTK